jgi:hypothetical protein
MNYEDLIKIKPKYVYYVLGLRRSGNHLFISWIISNYTKVLFFNDINFNFFQNNLSDFWCYKEKNQFNEKINQNLLSVSDNWDNIDCLIISLEDKTCNKFTETINSLNFATAKKIYKIIVIRDLLNCITSRLIKHIKNDNARHIVPINDYIMKLWLSHYHDILCIHFNYNKFIISPEYRTLIQKELNLVNISEEVLYSISNFFNGSSFENDFNFLDRYKNYLDNYHINKILNNKTIMDILESEFNID